MPFSRDDDDTPSQFESELASMFDGDDDDFLDIDTVKGEVNIFFYIQFFEYVNLLSNFFCENLEISGKIF